MGVILQARGLSKRYAVAPGGAGRDLRSTLVAAARAPLRWLRGEGSGGGEPFYALRNVSFEVRRGEVLGIIGRNGAGKSTLLKLLARITAPTEGEIRLRGRVASLLEVGTGFHPDLTGRENVYLNGAILGMTRAEIRGSFDEIVAFAGVERFLDMPVKFYSSGMYVRLAFAVAAHLRPEILIVDEVLAVGDAAFQKKCIGKIQDDASKGRTVLLVSHNMAAIARLCTRALLLQGGQVAADGPVHGVIHRYLGGAFGESPHIVDFEKRGACPGDEVARLLRVAVVHEGGPTSHLAPGSSFEVHIDYELLQEATLGPVLSFHDAEGYGLFSSAPEPRPGLPGRHRAVAVVPGGLLTEGLFSLDLRLVSSPTRPPHVHEAALLSFHVHDAAENAPERGDPWPGALRPRLEWPLVHADNPR